MPALRRLKQEEGLVVEVVVEAVVDILALEALHCAPLPVPRSLSAPRCAVGCGACEPGLERPAAPRGRRSETQTRHAVAPLSTVDSTTSPPQPELVLYYKHGGGGAAWPCDATPPMEQLTQCAGGATAPGPCTIWLL
ncbi:unnamed protein product [Lampetra fluviatilis]